MRKIAPYKGVELLVPRRVKSLQMPVGRRGSKNVMTRVLKDAILLAAAESKHAKGGGVAGYLVAVANARPDLFVPLLAKALLLQEKVRGQTANQFRPPPIV
jgi:hypothetical protein